MNTGARTAETGSLQPYPCKQLLITQQNSDFNLTFLNISVTVNVSDASSVLMTII